MASLAHNELLKIGQQDSSPVWVMIPGLKCPITKWSFADVTLGGLFITFIIKIDVKWKAMITC